jgi:hypothetical protein
MIDAVVSEHVNAPTDIASRRCIGIRTIGRASFPQRFAAPVSFVREGDTTVVEVDHVEGKVVNVLRDISSTRPCRLAAPFVKSLVLARMHRYVVEPLKAAAESER